MRDFRLICLQITQISNTNTNQQEASKKNRQDVIELLLEYGDDLNMNIDIDRGPLAIACDDGNFAMAEYLLSQGANPNLIKEGYRYPLYDAARTGNLQMIDLLLEHGADRKIHDGDVFGIASCGGRKSISALFKALELSPTEREKYLDKALQTAAHFVNISVCSWLLTEQGANPSFEGGEYGSPLAAAVSNTHLFTASDINDRLLLVSLLLKHSAIPNTHALETALKNRQSKAATALLDAGADVGGEVLQAAARYTPSLLPRLLSLGADVNAISGGVSTEQLSTPQHTHTTSPPSPSSSPTAPTQA